MIDNGSRVSDSLLSRRIRQMLALNPAATAIRWKSAAARCSCQFSPGTAKLAGGHFDSPGRLVQNFTATASPRSGTRFPWTIFGFV